MTTPSRVTDILLDPDVLLGRHITQEFSALPNHVSRAQSEPELFARWIGSRRHVATVEGFLRLGEVLAG